MEVKREGREINYKRKEWGQSRLVRQKQWSGPDSDSQTRGDIRDSPTPRTSTL